LHALLNHEPRPNPMLAWVVFVLALAVRLTHFAFVHDTPLLSRFVADSQLYAMMARDILRGEFFFHVPILANILYPLCLAPVFALGLGLVSMVFVQLVLDAFTAFFLFKLAERVCGAAPAFLSGLVYAFYGPAVLFAGLPLGESPAIFLLTLSAWLAFSALRGRRPHLPALLAGVALGLGALGRPNIVALYPLLALGVIWEVDSFKDQAAPVLISMLLGLLIALAPFSAYNRATLGTLSPFPPMGGVNIFLGNNDTTTGVYTQVPGISNMPGLYLDEARALAEQRTGQAMSYKDADSYWMGQGRAWLWQNPLKALRLYVFKALYFMNAEEVPLNVSYGFAARFSWVLRSLAWLSTGAIMALGLLGLLVPCRNRPAGATLKFATLGLAGTVLLFFISTRYRLFCLPFIIILAGHGLWYVLSMLRDFRFKNLPASLLLLGLFAGVCFLPARSLGLPDMRAFDHYKYGLYLGEEKQYPEAIQELERAVALVPGFQAAQQQLEQLYIVTGEPQKALPVRALLLSLNPGDTDRMNSLGARAYALGKDDEAETLFNMVVSAAPEEPTAYYNLAAMCLTTGEPLAAGDLYQKALSLGMKPNPEFERRLMDEKTALGLDQAPVEPTFQPEAPAPPPPFEGGGR